MRLSSSSAMGPTPFKKYLKLYGRVIGRLRMDHVREDPYQIDARTFIMPLTRPGRSDQETGHYPSCNDIIVLAIHTIL